MKFYLANLDIRSPHQWHQLFGLDLMYQLFKDTDVIELIGKERNFYPPNLYSLTDS